jgi:hypothetical protein
MHGRVKFQLFKLRPVVMISLWDQIPEVSKMFIDSYVVKYTLLKIDNRMPFTAF